MFKKNDYLDYFQQLYDIEVGMEHECVDLKKMIDNKEIHRILDSIEKEEKHHEQLVKEMIALVQ